MIELFRDYILYGVCKLDVVSYYYGYWNVMVIIKDVLIVIVIIVFF